MNLEEAYKEFMSKGMYDKAFSCLTHLYNGWEYYPQLCEFRKQVSENRELLKKAYLLSARDHFDDFMIYIEWNRPLKEK